MADMTASLNRAITLVDEAWRATAEAASVLRDDYGGNELATSAVRLEAELGLLGVRLRKLRYAEAEVTAAPEWKS